MDRLTNRLNITIAVYLRNEALPTNTHTSCFQPVCYLLPLRIGTPKTTNGKSLVLGTDMLIIKFFMERMQKISLFCIILPV